jgi:co-chaperonin GroES (HSP10)
MNIQPVYDKVLVEVESEWKSEIKGKHGVTGVVFENDIDRSVGAQRKGKVVAVPRAISKDHYMLKLIKDIILVGDIIYTHFNSILPDTKIELKIAEKPYYLVNMEQIFAIVRDGQIRMYGGRVLAEPIFDSDIDDLGGLKVRKTQAGIISELNVKHNFKKATLTHIGNPLEGERKTDVAAGDVIFYEKDSDFENEIEGKNYFCMMQEDIQMKEV